MADVFLASCGIFEPIRCHVEVWGDDATGRVTEIRYQNPSAKTANLKLTNGADTYRYSLTPGAKTLTIRSLKIALTGTGDTIGWNGKMILRV